ncbi:MAG: hypothetical protein IJ190_12695 [Prevotella sp.]|nr:hypothetical protein [Prevotella sp.]
MNTLYNINKVKGILLLCCLFLVVGCSKDIEGPSLPAPEGVTIAEGVALGAEQLFGIWEGTLEVGETKSDHFEQSYKVEFQSVDDQEAILSHWFVDAQTSIRDSVCNMEYAYSFDGKTIELTPTASAKANGAVAIKAVHTGNNVMNLYTTNGDITTLMCTLTRTGDPEPAITGVNRTLPKAGEKIILTGRNLQFVDHIYLPTTTGEEKVSDFTSTSKQIEFVMPAVADLVAGPIRCLSEGAHVSAYSPYMFCNNCVFFRTFSTNDTKAPYTGSEFENTIDITQSLFDKIAVHASDALPEGHALAEATDVINPDYMLTFFGDTPVAWAVDGNLDPSTGNLRFSFGDRIQYVIDHSDGLITDKSKCANLAVEMDIYVYTDGEPVWDTGFISFRLDKDQGKSLTQSWFAQTAMWDMENPVSFADGWQTFTIPLNTFKVTESTYPTLGSLKTFLVDKKKQTIIKMLNYQLDALHPAHAVSSFQFCIANMRLVPYGIPNNTKENE